MKITRASFTKMTRDNTRFTKGLEWVTEVLSLRTVSGNVDIRLYGFHVGTYIRKVGITPSLRVKSRFNRGGGANME